MGQLHHLSLTIEPFVTLAGVASDLPRTVTW